MMMEAATAPQPEPAEYIQLWSESLAQVLGQITGSAVPCAVRAEAPADPAPEGEGDLWAVVTATGGLRGEMSLRLAPAIVLRLAEIFMSEPPTPEAQATGDHRDAVIELLRQVAGIVTTSAKARWGEIQLLVEAAAAAPSWPSAGTFWLQAGEEAAAMTLAVVLSAALVAGLRAEKTEASKIAAEPKPAAAAVAVADSEKAPATLDVLMDVQLAMTMRFGSRRMLLREVLDLNPGSVIELDRKVQEPVDLLLDGRIVARGEVVVIEGNYGLRVTDISPLEGGSAICKS
jgi:flagellar motor switch protein FliN/FliY